MAEEKILWSFETACEKLDMTPWGLRWKMRTDKGLRDCMKRIGKGKGKIYFDPQKLKGWVDGMGLEIQNRGTP